MVQRRGNIVQKRAAQMKIQHAQTSSVKSKTPKQHRAPARQIAESHGKELFTGTQQKKKQKTATAIAQTSKAFCYLACL